MTFIKTVSSRLCRQFRKVVWNRRKYGTEIRNIGIMAHIDAGKTTTTERMLFYSGYIKKMGDIDSGNTVMDYLPSEIERGITVQSAAISFHWNEAQINLIDTPGHVDFTIEVERSLRVLDGAVAIFDASRGVEAQSRTVWMQADNHNIPRLAFINKMDKTEASFTNSVDSLKRRLKANTLILQLPVIQDCQYIGVVDLITMERMEWDMNVVNPNQHGRKYNKHKLTRTDEGWGNMVAARTSIIEQLSDIYDEVALLWLDGENAGNAEKFPTVELKKWIRQGTLDQTIVPVLCGSSFKNIGIQPLLDAVVDYLPRPEQIQHSFLQYYNDTLSAMAFKVLHDKRLGSIIFVRVYSGHLRSGGTIYNVNKQSEEKIGRLMSVYADEYKDTKQIEAGNIAVISGFQNTVTGDTLVESKEAFEAAVNKANVLHRQQDDESSSDVSPVVLAAVKIPEPVFFCSVEVYSPTQEKALRHALDVLCREDPSVRATIDDGGSIMLSGMGELHMEIISERIKTEFKVDAYFGPIQVAYRECPSVQATHKAAYKRTILDSNYEIEIGIQISPSAEAGTVTDPSQVLKPLYNPELCHSAALGVVQAFQQGNLLGYPVMSATVQLLAVRAKRGCPPGLVTATAIKCTREALDKAACDLLEPVMNIEITTRGENLLQNILGDLAKRQAKVHNIESSDNEGNMKIVAEAPVSEMKGYASRLRSSTSGNADLSLQISGYQVVSEERKHHLKNLMRNFGS
uniref:ribosome-releasing factor 2, mitochondrial isoform X1 n=1 Tax=Ciona intestinalis TaxID=7719 RepID=UPI000180C387|nr:ribosome-releasing factor 2, mitochondrial isoform X1 [Ciona intestinalis]|eukprot:XP_002131331.1 ribosome-releasing factor 2, mitochondrial isoform X1 [Ciona intestinalis]